MRNEKDEANDRADSLDQQLKECQDALHAAESDRDDLHRKVCTDFMVGWLVLQNLAGAGESLVLVVIDTVGPIKL